MKWFGCAGVGTGVGIIYGILMWFIKSQLILIYSQAVFFRNYYDPNLVAFFGAALTSVLCLLVILSYKSIYSFFEDVALRLVVEDDEDE